MPLVHPNLPNLRDPCNDAQCPCEESDGFHPPCRHVSRPFVTLHQALSLVGFRGHVDVADGVRKCVDSEGFDALTVAELKEALRERGLPVSGRKADLIERLTSADSPFSATSSSASTSGLDASEAAVPPSAVQAGTIEVACASCGQHLSLPASHQGRFQCPTCGLEQTLSTAAAPTPAPVHDPMAVLSERYADARTTSTRLNIAGIVVGVLAVVVFFAGVAQFGPDPEDCTEIEYQGETALSCSGGDTIFEQTGAWNTLGVACCLLVPLALALPVVAQAIRPPALVTHQASYGSQGGSQENHPQPTVEWDSPVQRAIGAVSLLFGGSLVLGTVALALVILALIVLLIMALAGGW